MDRRQHARIPGVDQEPGGAIVVEEGSPVGERLEGGRIHLSRHRDRAAPPGVMEEVVEDLAYERLPGPDLHYLADPAAIEVEEGPAQHVSRRGADRDTLEQAAGPPSRQQIQ